MELKANDCRYGNYIIGTYESEDDNLVHETICEFKFYDCYNNYYNVETKERIEEFTGFKPIPSTEEWLLKLGFKQNKLDKVFEVENCQIEIYFFDNDIKCTVCVDSVINKNIKHVHQLQNLYFALTESGLTVA